MTHKLSNKTRESVTQIMSDLSYTPGAIKAYIDDATRIPGGQAHAIGPIERITHSKKTDRFTLHFRDSDE